MFPPSVAMLRICGVATSEAACASAVNPFRKRGFAAISCSAAGPCRPRAASHWPSRRPESARLLRAFAERGIRKEAAASWREYLLFLLARFLPAGDVVHCVSVAPFPRWRDAQCLRPIHMREMARSKARLTSCFFFGKRLHDFFRSDRNFINSHSDSIVDGVGD